MSFTVKKNIVKLTETHLRRDSIVLCEGIYLCICMCVCEFIYVLGITA